jgi:hypothetical protein
MTDIPIRASIREKPALFSARSRFLSLSMVQLEALMNCVDPLAKKRTRRMLGSPRRAIFEEERAITFLVLSKPETYPVESNTTDWSAAGTERS